MSDSSIRTKPSIEEPSNMHLLLSAFSSWLRVIATFLSEPRISVNCRRIKLTFSSSAILNISSFVYFISDRLSGILMLRQVPQLIFIISAFLLLSRRAGVL